ncbi:MAG: restriction endonuclease-like protein [Clostridiales bacterium]|nr:restriction endonuclease-like protein [Clostridiales bacterium]
MQHSGRNFKKMISFEDEKFSLSISGPIRLNHFENQIDPISVYRDYNTNNLRKLKFVDGITPYFFENTNYTITINLKAKNETLTLHHENLSLEPFTIENETNEGAKYYITSLNFRSNIGLSDLRILINGNCIGTLTLEIFPQKIDYQKDYIELMSEVNEEVYNLSFDFLRQTYLNMGMIKSNDQSFSEFYSILQHIISKLERSIDQIIKIPHHKVATTREIKPFHKIKKIDRTCEKWIISHTHYIDKLNGNNIPSKSLSVNKYTSYDTYENQFLKHEILRICKKIKAFREKYILSQRSINSNDVIKFLDRSEKSLMDKVNHSFLYEVSSYYPKDSFSLVFIYAQGYKEFFKYSQMLRNGLNIQSDLFKLSQKDLATLYEYWCFIKMNKILKKHFELVSSNLIKIDRSGIFFTITKGRTSKVKYLNKFTKEIFTISYNPQYNGDTLSQKPDNVLIIEKKFPDVTFHYAFDAKYRINYAEEGTKYYDYYKTPGPTEDDINTMHRYRDSIIYESNNNDLNQKSRLLFGAFVLFPYSNEKEFESHHFHKSIEKVNIGAFPLLPSTFNLFENFIVSLIKSSASSNYAGKIMQLGDNEYVKNVDFTERNVLIGSLRNPQQLQVCLNYNFYHLPLKNIDINNRCIRYVALSQSKKQFGQEAGIQYYGEVSKFEIVNRSEIKEIQSNSDELYVRIKIKKWEMITPKIQIRDFNVITSMYTSYFLLKNTKFISELCIKSMEEFYIWQELSRIHDRVKIKINTSDLNISTVLDGFSINQFDFHVIDTNLSVTNNQTGEIATFNLFNVVRSPKQLLTIINENSSITCPAIL